MVVVLVLVLVVVVVLSRAGNERRESGCKQKSINVDPAVHDTQGIRKQMISKGMFKISLRMGSMWFVLMRIGINDTQKHNKLNFNWAILIFYNFHKINHKSDQNLFKTYILINGKTCETDEIVCVLRFDI